MADVNSIIGKIKGKGTGGDVTSHTIGKLIGSGKGKKNKVPEVEIDDD